MFRFFLRFISFCAAAVFLYNATLFIFYNFGFLWTLVAYFVFFISFFFFPIWAYFIFGYFDITTNIAWLITVLEAFYQIRYEERFRRKQIEEYIEKDFAENIGELDTILIFPGAKNQNEIYDFELNETLGNDLSKQFIILQVGSINKKVMQNSFSPLLDENLKDEHQRYLFGKAISSWISQIETEDFSSEKLSNLESHQFVTGDKFVVMDKDSNFYIAGS